MHRSPSPALALLIRSNEVVQHLSPYRIAFRRARRSKTAKTRRGRGADRKKTTTPDMNAAARHGPLLHANSEPIDDRHRLGWPRGAGDITRGMAGQRTREVEASAAASSTYVQRLGMALALSSRSRILDRARKERAPTAHTTYYTHPGPVTCRRQQCRDLASAGAVRPPSWPRSILPFPPPPFPPRLAAPCRIVICSTRM